MTEVGLTKADCEKAAYLVKKNGAGDYRLKRGAAAVNYTLRSLSGKTRIGWRLLGYLYLLPVVRQIEDIVYSVIVRIRHRIHGS